MPECDCIRPTTPEGVYHESTCALRLTERDLNLRELLERVYDQAVLNRGYVTSALLDEIRSKGLGS